LLDTDLQRLPTVRTTLRWSVGSSLVLVSRVRCVAEQGGEQAVVRIAQPPELLGGGGVGVAVGMPLHGELAEGALDLLRARAGWQAEKGMGVGHGRRAVDCEGISLTELAGGCCARA